MSMAIERPRSNRGCCGSSSPWRGRPPRADGRGLGQLWKISSAPDNVPIVAMIPLVIFFTWFGLKQAKDNDQLIGTLEADPALAKTHHRKTQPWRPGWARELHVWPYLLRDRVPRRRHRHRHPVRLVDHAQRAARRAGQPEPDDEPVEGAVVLPRPAGDARLLRSRGSRASSCRASLVVGLMVFPYVDSNPLRQRLLHLAGSASSRSGCSSGASSCGSS